MSRHRVASLVAVVVLLLCPGGLAPRAASAQPRTFGTASEIAHVVAAAEFTPSFHTAQWSYSGSEDPVTGIFARFATTSAALLAGLRLPAGAVVTRLEVSGCDDSGSTELLFHLSRSKAPPGTGYERLTAQGGTGAGATPGCGVFTTTPLSPPLVIDNAATYWINIGAGAGTLLESARVFYRLQVSPAPAAATFGDVPPSHPFFQFVEALVASGITAGCGGGNYCPDAPLTRGQMAVFLAKGLGLHFAP